MPVNSADDSVTMLFELEMILSTPRYVSDENNIARSRRQRCNIPTSLRPEILNRAGEKCWISDAACRRRNDAREAEAFWKVFRQERMAMRPANVHWISSESVYRAKERWRERKGGRERERKMEWKKEYRENGGHVLTSALRNRAKNRPAANFDLFPSWRPSIFYRIFNSIPRHLITELNTTWRLCIKKWRFCVAILICSLYVVRNGSITS